MDAKAGGSIVVVFDFWQSPLAKMSDEAQCAEIWGIMHRTFPSHDWELTLKTCSGCWSSTPAMSGRQVYHFGC